MKFSFLILLSICFLFSCKKTTEEISPDPSPLIGSWRWVLATGGLQNAYYTPQNSGNTWTLVLNYGYTYSQTGTLNGAPSSGSYSLFKEGNTGTGRNMLEIQLTSGKETYAYSFRGDSLRLDNKIELDGLSYFLVRQ